GVDTTALAGYIELIQSLDQQQSTPDTDTDTHADTETAPPLRAILSRWLERSQIKTTAAPHFGMGLPRYTTFTSPIRKYTDFLVHRAIKACLHNKMAREIAEPQLTQLQEQLDRSRQAVQLAEQWLKCEYLQKAQAFTHRGKIAHINSSGFTVRLDDNGIEGFVDTRQLPEKYSFDASALRLSTGNRVYQLEQTVDIAVTSIDLKKRAINFQLLNTHAAAPETP